MKFITFIFENAGGIVFLLALIASIVTAFAKKDFQFLNNAAFQIVTEAEKKYGASTGIIKKSFAVDKLYQKLPWYLKMLISESMIEDVAEKALENAKKKWKEYPQLLSNSEEKKLWQ